MQFPRKQEIGPAKSPEENQLETRQETVTAPVSSTTLLPGRDAAESRLSIGSGVKITGKVEKCGVLEVCGVLEADVTADEIIIDHGGSVVGSLEARTLDNSGHLDGTANVREQLTVRTGGVVDGSLTYGSLCVEAGGIVNGDLKSGAVEKAPTLKKSAEPVLPEAPTATV